jgi:hypothetical protein
MTSLDLAQQRLFNQRLVGAPFESPVDVVQWLCAVQSQDYAGGKWALGMRLQGVSDAALDQAFNEGAILRTHVMRPTWHFVTPADICWMLELTAKQVKARFGYYNNRLGLDSEVLAKSNDVLVKALEGGKQLTRAGIASTLQQAGIDTNDNLRFGHILANAEQDGVIVSGGRQGKQFTYALLPERAPQLRVLARDEALAELARRYFESHGPATLKDYVWWSGLTVSDARAGIEMVKSQLAQEEIGGQAYWFTPSTRRAAAKAQPKSQAPVVHLLPNYDEYIVAYTDRSAISEAVTDEKLDSRGNILFQYTIVIDGQIVGTWKRTFKKNTVVIALEPFRPLSADEEQAVTEATRRYGEFLSLSVVIA